MNVLARLLPVSLIIGILAGAMAGCIVMVDDHCEAITCGQNAICDAGICECFEGYRGDDPSIAGCDPVQIWRVTDGCDDGQDTEWRLFAQERDWAWPEMAGSDGNVFLSNGLDSVLDEQIVCHGGETICFGGESGDQEWGVGLNGEESCESCCFECNSDFIDYGILSCDQ